jgi:hypothetical protein
MSAEEKLAALEAQAIDQDARAADGNVEESATQRLEKALAEAEGALEARTRIAGAEWPQEWPEPDSVEVDGAPGPGGAVAEESTDVASVNATTDESAETAKTDVVADAQVLVGKEQADDETVREFVDLQIRVAKDMRGDHDVWYRVHTQDGWLAWVSNGASAGEYDGKRNDAIVDDVEVAYVTKEQSQRFEEADYDLAALEGGVDSESQAAASDPTNVGLESVETKAPAAALQAADEKAVAVAQATTAPAISYRVHVQTYGWMDAVTNGAMAGTEGEAKRLEAIQIMLVAKGGQAPAEAGSVDGADPSVKSGVSYRANVEGFGWMGWVQDGAVAGTEGQSLQMEAVELKLSSNLAKRYDLYYRVHVQDIGWIRWVKNGTTAGTTGQGKRMEAIENLAFDSIRAECFLISDGECEKTSKIIIHDAHVDACRYSFTQYIENSIPHNAFFNNVIFHKNEFFGTLQIGKHHGKHLFAVSKVTAFCMFISRKCYRVAQIGKKTLILNV